VNHDFNFAGKVILVTGGSSGIGRAASILFARHGAKVVIGDINAAGEETVEAIKSEKGEATFIQTDVRNAGEVKNLIATAVKTYGGLNCAFNNAGILPPMAMLADTEESTFDQTFDVDVKGVFLAMKYEIQQMLKTGGGVIVNNASIAGLIAERGLSTYVAAKHAVIGLSKAAAIEYEVEGCARRIGRRLHLLHREMRFAYFRINAPGSVGLAIDRFPNLPLFLVEICRRVLQRNWPVGRTRLGGWRHLDLEF
jgi:NAD(P)-dependent dehydrogenase (short-subunit alcohol dehydrogenase family)